MGWRDDLLDVALSALSEVPGGGAVVRLLDKWETDARIGKVEHEVRHLLETIGRDGRVLDEHVEEAIRLALSHGGADLLQLRKTDSCLAIMRALNTRSGFAQEWDPQLHRDQAIAILKNLAGVPDPVKELRAVVFELKRVGLILVSENANGPVGMPPIEAIGPGRDFFCRTDPLFQSWNPEADAKEICHRSRAERQFNAADLDAVLRWGPRRFNSAAMCALRRGWIEVPYETANDQTYVLPWAYLTEEGEFFLNS